MPRKFLYLVFFVAALSGCRQTSTSVPSGSSIQQKTFTVRGKIISTDATHVTLDHEAIPGFMDAMIMPYKLKDPSIVGELHPGDRITAKILVYPQGPSQEANRDTAGFRDPELDQIVVIAQARPDYKPAVQYHVPQPGDTVPDFKLLNQSDHTIHLAQFKGKVLLITFIYTRCPISDFCPRMSRNFAEVDKALSADAALYPHTHLLSISFDPTYDTPKVLRSYGAAYTGNFTNEKFSHWDFAAPPVKDLGAITRFFNVGITPGDSKSLTHSLSTILIGKDGKVVAWFPTNDWQPAEIVAKIKQAATA